MGPGARSVPTSSSSSSSSKVEEFDGSGESITSFRGCRQERAFLARAGIVWGAGRGHQGGGW